jgi:ABC-type transporter Mla subunit MlaD
MTSPKGDTRSPAVAAEVVPARPPFVSHSLEVLETLEMQSTLSALEARLDSLEIDIARQAGTRDDDARRIAGEMAVMRARVEDALNAFAQTADDVRGLSKGLEERLEQVAAHALGDEHVQGLRAEMSAGIDGVMAGVADVLGSVTHDVGGRIDALGDQMRQISHSLGTLADHVGALAPVSDRLEALESKIVEREG